MLLLNLFYHYHVSSLVKYCITHTHIHKYTLLLFSHYVVSESLRPHGLLYARLPCPSLALGVCSNSCPLSLWCHPTIEFSVTCFSCPWSFLVSGSFPMSQLFTSGGQSTGISITPSVLAMNIQGWLPLDFDCFDLLAVQGTLKSLLQHYSLKASILHAQPCLWEWSNSHIHTWLLEKP